jgi:hypothetical protein
MDDLLSEMNRQSGNDSMTSGRDSVKSTSRPSLVKSILDVKLENVILLA